MCYYFVFSPYFYFIFLLQRILPPGPGVQKWHEPTKEAWERGSPNLKVILTVKSSVCLQMSFGPLINYI